MSVLGDLDAEMARIFAALDDLAQRLRAMLLQARQDGEPLRRKDLRELHPATFALLGDHPGTVMGAGTIMAPGILQDSWRWLDWWWPREGAPPEPLRTNLDPAAPDFYDYCGEDWYVESERTRQRHIAGPFVDHVCTGEYSLTLTVPVSHDGEFLGVCGADILVSSLERSLLPRLVGHPRPLVVATGGGRVVVSTHPQWSPGLLLPAEVLQAALAVPGSSGARPESPLRSWVVVEPPSRLA